ncbi:MAG: FMN-binding negative transcriptional regulator [Rhizobiales bacterium]|nr:FMN-binding negative transcriptional regulator [Hyphomicrobiales bacterium]
MYIPAHFRADDRALAFDLIEEIRLGTMISSGDGLDASHLPFLVRREEGAFGTLVGHCARANAQWPTWEQAPDVLVTFVSPNTHVSPSWYTTHPRAPTWLYAAVHVRGRVHLKTDREAMREIVVAYSNELEPPMSGWSVDSIPDYVEKLLPGIVGFHIEITDIKIQLRLAQQNGVDDRLKVLAALRRGTATQQQVADLISRFAFDDAGNLLRS